MQRIIYPVSDRLEVVTPKSGVDITTVANKSIPLGVPYKIISIDDLPDRENRDAWTADFSEPDGYGGA